MKLIVFQLLFLLTTVQLSAQSAQEQIKTIMQRQLTAWNKGDVEGFMKGYWESDQLIFIGSKGLTYGYFQTLANYKKGYPDRDAMGYLEFQFKEFIPLGNQHLLVIGQWKISRSDGEVLQGHFSLTWENKEEGWVIIADHSS